MVADRWMVNACEGMAEGRGDKRIDLYSIYGGLKGIGIDKNCGSNVDELREVVAVQELLVIYRVKEDKPQCTKESCSRVAIDKGYG